LADVVWLPVTLFCVYILRIVVDCTIYFKREYDRRVAMVFFALARSFITPRKQCTTGKSRYAGYASAAQLVRAARTFIISPLFFAD